MAAITFVEVDGREHRIEVLADSSLMELAIMNNVRGVDAECGGACSCATCHVLVPQVSWIPGPDEMELEMLESAREQRTPESRLGCQVRVSPSSPELRVRIPGNV